MQSNSLYWLSQKKDLIWTWPDMVQRILTVCQYLNSGISCRDIVPLGQVRSNFNFNLERKRVLNFVNVVSDEDNVKQDMSIDVYGRKEKQEADDAQKEASAKPAEVRLGILHLSIW